MMARIWSANVGTIPMLIVLRQNYGIYIGNIIRYRDESEREYHRGVIEDIHYNRRGEPCWLRLSRR